MNTKIQEIIKKIQDRVLRLRDVRVAGQAIFVVLVLLISWSGVKSIQSNYALQKQITGMSQQNDLQALQNNNLKLGNEYYKSNQYLELSARQNFGLAAAGEKLVVVPKEVALKRTVPFKDAPAQVAVTTSKERNNFEAWVNFFLNRRADR
jgi:cell division protein FtsB